MGNRPMAIIFCHQWHIILVLRPFWNKILYHMWTNF